MKVNKIIFIMTVTLFIVSCKKKLTPKEYDAWLHDTKNEMHQVRTIAGLQINVLYKPNEWVVFENKDMKEQVNKNTMYFQMKVKNINSNATIIETNDMNIANSNERLYYLQYKLKDDIYLELDNKEKIPCLNCMLVRVYNLSNELTFELFFDVKNTTYKEIRFVFDSPAFNVGKINYVYNKSKLNNIPALKDNSHESKN